jgi:hypothetical protein
LRSDSSAPDCSPYPSFTGSAVYAVSEAFGWSYGLDRNPGRAKQFYGVIAAPTLIETPINFAGINPIDALFWTAVMQRRA